MLGYIEGNFNSLVQNRIQQGENPVNVTKQYLDYCLAQESYGQLEAVTRDILINKFNNHRETKEVAQMLRDFRKDVLPLMVF